MNPLLMHGQNWQGQDVSGWWISEKLNGWRGHWTGTAFLTRSGQPYHAPAWFLDGMPTTPLDCELWAGRGRTHDDVNHLVHAGQWHLLTLRPFDVPVKKTKIETAVETLRTLALPAHVRPVEYRRAESTADAIAIMRQIVADGGEGVMARCPTTEYWPQKATPFLLKIKP